MDKVVTINSSQSLLDLSLQYYGTIERVFDLIEQIGVESIDSDPTGYQITVTSANTSNSVYQYCLKNNITIGNKQSPEVLQPVNPIVRYRVTMAGDSRVTTGSDNRIAS